jgi:hypothetical protein
MRWLHVHNVLVVVITGYWWRFGGMSGARAGRRYAGVVDVPSAAPPIDSTA